jgi:hypothetical protein
VTTSRSADLEKPRLVHAGGRVGIDYGELEGENAKFRGNMRTQFGDAGCNIYGHPSVGGVIMRTQADAIEMQYLGLDRLEPQTTRSKDQKDEDAFCLELINIGGKWWPSERRANLIWWELNYEGTDIEDETAEEMREVWVGWPELGGLLISEFQSTVGEIKIPEDIGRLRMALTNKERCKLLRTRFGAVYYKDPREYAGFSKQHAILSGSSQVS